MSSYQGSTSVNADAQSVFTFVSSPENLAKYVPCISHADLGYGGVVHVRGECPHGQFRGVGGFNVDEENLRLRWDSRANLNYRGWLHVTEHVLLQRPLAFQQDNISALKMYPTQTMRIFLER